MDTRVLNGAWSVRSETLDCIGEAGLASIRQAREDWLVAQVPGEIHLDLIRAGRMPDPSVGANMPRCRWPETLSWWYRTAFDLDEAFLRHERQCIVFDGLDLYAQVFVNGRRIGEAADAFVPAVFDAKPFLVGGANELVVRLTAGSELAIDDTLAGQGQSARRPGAAAGGAIPNPMREGDLYGHRIWPGRKWLRKPQFTYGWDWVDALPNIGIWRGVRLEGRSHAVLHDLRLDTLRRDGGVALEMDAVIENLHPWSERACALELEIRPPDEIGASIPSSGGEALELAGGKGTIRRRYAIDAPPGRSPLRDVIEIPDARLWWPNGFGDQPLYRVTARVTDGAAAACDGRAFAIGLRTVELDRSRLAEGSRFCIRVNGEEVFCRGGNLGPHDAILARVSDAKYETLVAEAKNARMNMFRINGCSIFEGPAFYEACDRAGILIWHDFMLTCTTYPDDDAGFREAVRAESEAAIRSLRHHPSIALWCGNNECTWGFRDWWNPEKDRPLELGGQALYNRVLPDLCRRLDPRRSYWTSSPCGGEAPNSELAGDCHWWHPFTMSPDIERRIRHEVFDECRARFVSEYGTIGPCPLDSIREYLAEDEMHPESLAWRMHTNSFENETLSAAIRRHYADPERLPVTEYVRYGQQVQALLHGGAMEALRFRKHDPSDDCQGALIWSYSDCWGETGWSILDYYLRRKASYYAVRRACAPVKAIVRRRDGRFVTRVVNDTLRPFHGTIETGWWRLDGGEREVNSRRIDVPVNGMREAAVARAPEGRDPRRWLYAAVLRDPEDSAIDQSICLLRPFRELERPAPEIAVRRRDGGEIEVSSPVYCHAVSVEDHGSEVISDNGFDLLPGVAVRVRVSEGHSPEALRFKALDV